MNKKLLEYSKKAMDSVAQGILSDAVASNKDVMCLLALCDDDGEDFRFKSLDYIYDILLTMVKADAVKTFIECDGKNIKGFVALISFNGVLCIQQMFVEPKYRNNGNGKNITKKILKFADKNSMNIGLYSTLGAEQFWVKMGFKTEGLVNGKIFMTRRLNKGTCGVFDLNKEDANKITEIALDTLSTN